MPLGAGIINQGQGKALTSTTTTTRTTTATMTTVTTTTTTATTTKRTTTTRTTKLSTPASLRSTPATESMSSCVHVSTCLWKAHEDGCSRLLAPRVHDGCCPRSAVLFCDCRGKRSTSRHRHAWPEFRQTRRDALPPAVGRRPHEGMYPRTGVEVTYPKTPWRRGVRVHRAISPPASAEPWRRLGRGCAR